MKRNAEWNGARWPGLLPGVIFFLIAGLLISSANASVNGPGGMTTRRILFISAYHPSFPTFFQQTEGLRASFALQRIELDIEFMDSKRFPAPLDREKFTDYLTWKLKRLSSYSAIVTGDDNALSFALEHQDTLFKEIPIVFFGVNNVDFAMAQNKNPWVTGVVEAVSMEETIKLMLELHPVSSRVVAIADDLPSSQGDLHTFYHLARAFPGVTFSHIPLGELTWKQFEQELKGVEKESAVLLLSAYRDKTGRTLQFYEALSIIKENLNLPLYHLWYHGIGRGILGGKVISHLEQAKTAADMVLQILSGTLPENIKVVSQSPNTYVFDHKELEIWGISRAKLPANSVILNSPYSFYRTHKTIVWTVSVAFVVLMLLVFGLVFNISGRRKLEKSLRRSEKKFRYIVENQNDLVVQFDGDHRLGFVSPNYCTLFGVKEEALLGRSFFHLIHDDDIEGVKASLAGIRNPPHTTQHEERVKTVNSWRWFSWSLKATVDEKGRVLSVIAVGRDITEKKQADKALWETTDRFQKMFDSQLDAVFLLNKDVPPVIIDSNKAVETIFQYNSQFLVGKTTDIFYVDASSLEMFQQHLRKGIEKDGYLKDLEFVMKRKDGTTFPSGHTVLSLTDDAGIHTGWVSVVRDLTERKRMEEQLMQAQKMESIGNLAGGIAHDFNNLLFPILGFSEMLLEDFPQGSDAHSKIIEIVKAGKRGRDLVKQILIFSRHTEHEMSSVKIQDILKQVLTLTRATIPTSIHIQNNIDEGCGSILADGAQIHQVAMNLITNAYHAVGDSGIIDVSLQEIVTGNDKDMKPSAWARFQVTDDGCGIDKALINKIFDPYYTTKDQNKGTGLGLAMVFGIVKAHNGVIHVESELGKGSTFTIDFPLQKGGVMPENVENDHGLHPGGNESLLLVDDDRSILNIERTALERFGYRVTACSSSRQALNLFISAPDDYDLVVSDMSMPEMTGEQLAGELMRVKPDVKIIICTGFSETFSMKDAHKKGIKGFLMKPVMLADMACMVRDVLDN